MKIARASLFIDRYHQTKNGMYPVSLRVTYQRQRKYFPLNKRVRLEEFDKILEGKRLSPKELKLQGYLHKQQTRANEVISEIHPFDFQKFEKAFFGGTDDFVDDVYYGFKLKINELKANDQIKSAISLSTTLNSLQNFCPTLTYGMVNVEFASEYVRWLRTKKLSNATIGIYLRNLRTVCNRYGKNQFKNPFGSRPGQYKIPQSANVKKALNTDDLARLLKIDLSDAPSQKKARDLWLFLYLCNGMNVKDMCNLRYANIQGKLLTFTRAKTSNTSNTPQQTKVSLKDAARDVIRLWGNPDRNEKNYIFPFLREGMPPVDKQKAIDNLVRFINKHMARVGDKAGIKVKITTYTARHSFATVLKNNNVSLPFISESLGHSNYKTTQRYLASFEDSAIHESTDCLLEF